jgi:ABC-type Fe3+/spermidine/putrescine transport system ATPase subunit
VTQVEIIDMVKAYPRQAAPAVAGISLTVAPGMLMALLGASGSGKSTVLKLIAGVEHPDAGDVRLNGQSVLALPAHHRGAVLMFQKAYLFPFLSVAENIGFGLKLQRASRAVIAEQVRQMLALVELPGIEHKHPAQLSGGEQQRVALARALITRPRVLLLDEPFSSLDAHVRQTLQEAVRRIQREMGITTLLVTHDRGEALAMADQVALIDHGSLLACDTPQRLFRRPPTCQAARLMGITTFLSGTLRAGMLSTPEGDLYVAGAETTAGTVTYAIRPEHMRVCATPCPNSLPACLVDHTFRGEQYEYQLQVGGQLIRVRSFQPVDLPPSGDVHVVFPAEHLFPLAE